MKEKHDLVMKMSRSMSWSLSFLYDVETLTYTDKRHSEPSNKLKFLIYS